MECEEVISLKVVEWTELEKRQRNGKNSRFCSENGQLKITVKVYRLKLQFKIANTP